MARKTYHRPNQKQPRCVHLLPTWMPPAQSVRHSNWIIAVSPAVSRCLSNNSEATDKGKWKRHRRRRRRTQVPFFWPSCSSHSLLVSGQGGKSRPPTGGLCFPPGLQIPADLGLHLQAVGAETGQEMRTGGAGWRNRVEKGVGGFLDVLQLNSITLTQLGMGDSDSSWTRGFRLGGRKESLNARGSQAHGPRRSNVREQSTHSEGLRKADLSLARGGLGKESFAGVPLLHNAG